MTALPAADWIGLAFLAAAVLIVAVIMIREMFFTDKGSHAAPRWLAEEDERLADTDVRARYAPYGSTVASTLPAYLLPPLPRTPILPAPVDEQEPDPVGPRVVPDAPDCCRCGEAAGHFEQRLLTVSIAEIASMFDTATFAAVA